VDYERQQSHYVLNRQLNGQLMQLGQLIKASSQDYSTGFPLTNSKNIPGLPRRFPVNITQQMFKNKDE